MNRIYLLVLCVNIAIVGTLAVVKGIDRLDDEDFVSLCKYHTNGGQFNFGAFENEG